MSRVLVVDDEPAIGWSLREMLADEGHEVDLAANVDEALAAATRHPPDTILLDVRLPGRDGIEAIPDLWRLAGEVPIVIMTAFGDLDTAIRAVRAGAIDFLVKPFDLDHVSAVVARRTATPPSNGGTATPVDASTRQVADAIRDWAAAAQSAFARLPEPDLHHRTIRLVETTLLREALVHTGGNRTAAAKLLGLDRATLRTKLRQLGIDD
ncbi:MAG: response regulator [Pirellulales bacterium]